jgi:hypothetical protein
MRDQAPHTTSTQQPTKKPTTVNAGAYDARA